MIRTDEVEKAKKVLIEFLEEEIKDIKKNPYHYWGEKSPIEKRKDLIEEIEYM